MPADNGIRVANISRSRHIEPQYLKPILQEVRNSPRSRSKLIQHQTSKLRYDDNSLFDDSCFDINRIISKFKGKRKSRDSSSASRVKIVKKKRNSLNDTSHDQYSGPVSLLSGARNGSLDGSEDAIRINLSAEVKLDKKSESSRSLSSEENSEAVDELFNNKFNSRWPRTSHGFRKNHLPFSQAGRRNQFRSKGSISIAQVVQESLGMDYTKEVQEIKHNSDHQKEEPIINIKSKLEQSEQDLNPRSSSANSLSRKAQYKGLSNLGANQVQIPRSLSKKGAQAGSQRKLDYGRVKVSYLNLDLQQNDSRKALLYSSQAQRGIG